MPWLVIALLLARAHWHDKLEHPHILAYMVDTWHFDTRGECVSNVFQSDARWNSIYNLRRLHPQTAKPSSFEVLNRSVLRISSTMPFLVDVSRFAPRNRQSLGIHGLWGYPLDSYGLHIIAACYSLLLTFLEGLSQTWGSSSLREVDGSYRLFKRKYRVCRGNAAFLLRRRIVMQCAWVPCWSIHINIDDIRWHSKVIRRHHGQRVGIPDLSCLARIRILCRVWKVKTREMLEMRHGPSWSIMIHQKSVWPKLHAVSIRWL